MVPERAPESVADAYEKVWEGHLRQFGRAKIPTVELAKDGIFVAVVIWGRTFVATKILVVELGPIEIVANEARSHWLSC